MANITGTNVSETLSGTGADDVIYGLGGDDLIYGGGGDDAMYGGDGDDRIYSYGGVDTVDGGAGNDTWFGDYHTSTTSLTLTQGSAGSWSLSNGTTLSSIEGLSLTTGSGDDTFTFNGLPGTPQPYHIDGGAGANTLNIDLSSTSNPISALFSSNYNGAFVYFQGQVVDARDISTLNLTAGSGDDFIGLLAGHGSFHVDGGGGSNVARVDDSDCVAGVDFTLDTTPGAVSAFADGSTLKNIQDLFIFTGSGDDTLTGGAFLDSISGGGGNDLLFGGGGNDTLLGGAGDDKLDGGAGDDSLDGGGGVNTAVYNDATSAVAVSLAIAGPQDTRGAGTDTLVNIQDLAGSAFDDVLTGDAHANMLTGNAGDDVLSGLAGNDTVLGGAGNDTLHGGDGDDLLSGGVGDDSIDGGAGDDTIVGGRGADTLTGGPGADHFVFDSRADSEAKLPDVVTDFSSAEGDRIDLSRIDADTRAPGGQAFSVVGQFTHVPAQLVIAATAGGWLVEGDINGDGKPDFAIMVHAATALVASDFIL